MKKTQTIFKRNPDNMKGILNEQSKDCGWVFAGDGIATRKYDGTCCMILNGDLYKRRAIKHGGAIPDGFVRVDSDEITVVGWVRVSDEDQWHMEAFKPGLQDGTYELLGPKINGNPENQPVHVLLKHSDAERYHDVTRTFHGLRQWMEDKDIEGIVFHHPDGRMAKIKKRDYGMSRKII